MRNFKNLLKLSNSNNNNKKETNGNTTCFGVPVEDVVNRSKGDIPIVLEHVVQSIEESGITVEGLFRVPGSVTLLQVLKKAYDEGKIQDKTTLQRQCDDVHAMAGLLKLWIRELPEPLHTFALYDSFISVCAIEDKQERAERMRDFLHALPPANYNVLKYILGFLHKVGLNSDKNKMSFSNLAVVFAPTLIRPTEDNMARMLTDQKFVTWGTTLLIEEFTFLFCEESESDVQASQPHGSQVVPDVIVDEAIESEENFATMEDINNNNMNNFEREKTLRRLGSKQVGTRNLEFTPEKDKLSRRPKLTIQTTSNDDEQDNKLQPKFMISPARPPHSPSKSPHVSPLEYSTTLLDLVSQTVGNLFDSSFHVDDNLIIHVDKTPRQNNHHEMIAPFSSSPLSSSPVSSSPLSSPRTPSRGHANLRLPVFDSAANLHENLRLLTSHLPSSSSPPSTSPTSSSDRSISPLTTPTTPVHNNNSNNNNNNVPSISPTASSIPANLVSPTFSSSPEIGRKKALANSSDSIFPPVSPTHLSSPIVRSSSPSLAAVEENSRKQQQQQMLQQHPKLVSESRSLSFSDSLISRPSIFDTARSLQNLPSPSISSPISPLSPNSQSRTLQSSYSHMPSSSPPVYEKMETSRSLQNLSSPSISSSHELVSPSRGRSPLSISSTVIQEQPPSSPSPSLTPSSSTSSVSSHSGDRFARQRAGSEANIIYHDTPRPATASPHLSSSSVSSSTLHHAPYQHISSRPRSRSELIAYSAPSNTNTNTNTNTNNNNNTVNNNNFNNMENAYLSPTGKRNSRQRAASPNLSHSGDWEMEGREERGKDIYQNVKRNRKTWAPENVQNLYEAMLTQGERSPAPGSPGLSRREKEGSPRKTGSPQPHSGSPRADDGPLGFIQAKLEKERKQHNRPNELQLMTSIQIREEKIAIKRELRDFDNAYRKKYGQLPKKTDKEILRPLYQRYRDVKDLLVRAENPALPTRTSSPRRLSSPSFSSSSISSSSLSKYSSSPRSPAPDVYMSVPNLQQLQQLQHQQQHQQHLQKQQQHQQQQHNLQQQQQQQQQQPHAMNLGRAAGRRATMSFGYENPLNSQPQQQQQPSQNHPRQLSHGKSVSSLQRESSAPSPKGDLLANYKNLKNEKKQLQIMLHQYQNDFVKKHGRKVQFVEDREPVRLEYERYKDLKSELAAIEEQLLSQ